VVDTIRNSPFANLYNPENMFIAKDGSGAGNIWAKGYAAVRALPHGLPRACVQEPTAMGGVPGRAHARGAL
jgi:hypothetical protein